MTNDLDSMFARASQDRMPDFNQGAAQDDSAQKGKWISSSGGWFHDDSEDDDNSRPIADDPAVNTGQNKANKPFATLSSDPSLTVATPGQPVLSGGHATSAAGAAAAGPQTDSQSKASYPGNGSIPMPPDRTKPLLRNPDPQGGYGGAFKVGRVSIGGPNGRANENTTGDAGNVRANGPYPAAGQEPSLAVSTGRPSLSGGQTTQATDGGRDLGIAPPSGDPPKVAVKLHHDYGDISSAVYDDDGGTRGGHVPRGWEVVPPETLNAMRLPPGIFRDDGSGFFSALYRNKDTGKYVLAFRGTQPGWNPFKNQDIVADASQGIGHGAAQYDQAINVARLVNRMLGAGNVTYAGHSLGGGLAAAASLVTKTPAVTFNAAAVHQATLAPYRVNDKDAGRLITAYHVRGKLVGDLQGIGKSAIGDYLQWRSYRVVNPPGNTQGNKIELSPSSSAVNPLFPLNRHLAGEFVDH